MFGFNGMEKDNERSGRGNGYTTEFRQYDPRLGRWFSIDPLTGKFPWMSPYVGMNNAPLILTDVKGLEAEAPNVAPKQWKTRRMRRQDRRHERLKNRMHKKYGDDPMRYNYELGRRASRRWYGGRMFWIAIRERN